MIRVIAVDDEPLALRQLEIYISKVPFLELVGVCGSALEASRLLDSREVDAMFLDINMPDLSGLDFVRLLRHRPLTVFTTAYSEYAVDGFRVDAVDYLLKPFSLKEFVASAEKLKERFDLLEAYRGQSDNLQEDYIFLKADYKIIKVNVSDILYTESMSEYLKIYVAGETAPKLVLLSMAKLLEKLPENRFVRVHRSYMVNLAHIREVGGGVVEMDNGKTIPIGDSYRRYLLEKL